LIKGTHDRVVALLNVRYSDSIATKFEKNKGAKQIQALWNTVLEEYNALVDSPCMSARMIDN